MASENSSLWITGETSPYHSSTLGRPILNERHRLITLFEVLKYYDSPPDVTSRRASSVAEDERGTFEGTRIHRGERRPYYESSPVRRHREAKESSGGISKFFCRG